MTTAAGLEIASAGVETISGAGSPGAGSSSNAHLTRMGVRGAGPSQGAEQGASEAENARSTWQSALATVGIFPAEAETEAVAEAPAGGVAYKTVSQVLSGAPGPSAFAIQARSEYEPSSAATNPSELPSPTLKAVSIRSTMVSLDAPGSVADPAERPKMHGDALKAAHALRGDHLGKHATAQSAGKPKIADEATAAACLPSIATGPVVQAPTPAAANKRVGLRSGGQVAGSSDHAAELNPLAAQSRNAERADSATAKGDAGNQTGNEHAQAASLVGAGDSDTNTPKVAPPVQPAQAASSTGVQYGLSPSPDMQNSQQVSASAPEGSPLTSSQPASQQVDHRASGSNGMEGQAAVATAAEGRGKPKADGASRPPGSPSGHIGPLHAAAADTAHSTNQARVFSQDQPGLLPARDASGMQPPPNGARGSGPEAESSRTGTGKTGVHGTFASLDDAGNSPAPTWLHAGTRSAEAGFQDQDLGWVRVRAQMDPSGVHATLVPGSPYAAQALGGHLAGLNTYLAEHHTPVETLTMAAPESHGNERGMEHGTGQNAGQGNGAGSDNDPDASQAARTMATAVRPIVSTVSATLAAGR